MVDDILYSIFGIVPDRCDYSSSLDCRSLRRIFKLIIRKVHPDKCKLPNAHLVSQVVLSAYGVLCDADQELAYRLYGLSGISFPFKESDICLAIEIIAQLVDDSPEPDGSSSDSCNTEPVSVDSSEEKKEKEEEDSRNDTSASGSLDNGASTTANASKCATSGPSPSSSQVSSSSNNVKKSPMSSGQRSRDNVDVGEDRSVRRDTSPLPDSVSDNDEPVDYNPFRSQSRPTNHDATPGDSGLESRRGSYTGRLMVEILDHVHRRGLLKFRVRFNDVVEDWSHLEEMLRHPDILRSYLLSLKESRKRKFQYLIVKHPVLGDLFN